MARTAGLRRGEILNLTVNDVDFGRGRIIVQPKEVSKYTWRWVVKNKDRRELPLIDNLAQLLVDLHVGLPEGQPYLLLSTKRYAHLMELESSWKAH